MYLLSQLPLLGLTDANENIRLIIRIYWTTTSEVYNKPDL